MKTRIRELRCFCRHHISQQEFGRELGISRQAFADIESGRTDMKLSQAVKVADILGVTLEGLIHDTDPLVDELDMLLGPRSPITDEEQERLRDSVTLCIRLAKAHVR